MLSPRNSGRCVPKGEESKGDWVVDKSRLNLDKNIWKLNVLTSSVFSHSYKVVRGLSVQEICGVYDIPVEWAKVFRHRNSLPFVGEIPLKILQVVIAPQDNKKWMTPQQVAKGVLM